MQPLSPPPAYGLSYLLSIISSGPTPNAASPSNPFSSTPEAPHYSPKSLSSRITKPLPSDPQEPIFKDEEDVPAVPVRASPSNPIDELLDVLNRPQSVVNIQKLIHFTEDVTIPIALRIKALLSVPRTPQTHRLCILFAKDDALDVNLRASCALAAFSCVQKYHLLNVCFDSPGLEKALKMECFLKLVKADPKNISEDELKAHLKPNLYQAYIHHIAHSIFIAYLHKQVLYDETMPILLRAKCSWKALPVEDHSAIIELLAHSVALPMYFRVSATAALPSGSHKDELIKSFMEDPDLSTRVLWAKRLPPAQRDPMLRQFLEDPSLSPDLQYICASSLEEGPLKENYMILYSQNQSFPLELQASAARTIRNKDLRNSLLSKFAQREDLSHTFRLPCILEMPRSALRTSLLIRFAQDESLDINFRVPCMIALPKDNFSLGLLKEALKDGSLRLSYIQKALNSIGSEEALTTSLRTAFAMNTLLPAPFRDKCALALPESYRFKKTIVESLSSLIRD